MYFLLRVSEIWEKIQNKIVNGLYFVIQHFYKPLLQKAIEHPFSSLSFAGGVLILTIGILSSGFLKFTFFPAVEDDLAIATIEYSSGTPLNITREGYEKLEDAATVLENQLLEEFPSQKIIRNRLSTIGYLPMLTKT